LNCGKYNPPPEAADILSQCPHVTIASTTDELLELACGGPHNGCFEVAYDIPGRGRFVEATVVRVRNGISENYTDPYMRRRDPDCLVVGDSLPTDKDTFHGRFCLDFASVREEAFAWLKMQELAIFGFFAGQTDMDVDALAIARPNLVD